MLTDCLTSVAALHRLTRDEFAIVVVDNSESLDMRKDNRHVANTALDTGAFTILEEDSLGIPFARNRALNFAVDRGADAVVFLDDDQTVPPDWLQVMVNVWREEGADVVKSSVCWQFDGEGRYREVIELMEPKTGPDGRLRNMKLFATNGVLIDRKVFTEWGLRFDEDFGLAGGSDSDFSFRSCVRGGKHILTSETQACEICPTSKQTLRWLIYREFRIGGSLAPIALQKRGRALLLYKYICQTIRFGIFALALIPLPRRSLHYQLRTARVVGLCWGCLGLRRIAVYKQVHGR